MNKPALVRLFCGVGLSAGVALSPRLWGLGPRTFPRVPVAGPPLPAAAEAAATLVLLAGMMASAWRPRLRRAAAAAALLLAWTDQERWQPWAWEYLLVGVLAGGELLPTRLILGGIVAWAGFWKLGPGYRQGVAPWLGAPLPPGVRGAVLAVPYFEMLTGAALLVGVRAARWPTRGALLTMHGTALALLVPRGWNSIVWPWQVTSVAIGWVALGPGGDWRTLFRHRSDAAVAAAAPGSSALPALPATSTAGRSDPDSSPTIITATPCKPVRPPVAAWLAVLIALSLPALWPLGVVNAYLAWRLYTGDATDVELQWRALDELNVPLSPAPWRVRRLLEPQRQTGQPETSGDESRPPAR